MAPPLKENRDRVSTCFQSSFFPVRHIQKTSSLPYFPVMKEKGFMPRFSTRGKEPLLRSNSNTPLPFEFFQNKDFIEESPCYESTEGESLV